jgi:carbohydrate-selective porin OprB
MITDVYGLFGRFGWQEPRVSDLEFHWSLGGQMTGKFWGRPEDIVAVGVGQAIPGKPYGDAGNPNNSETHLETYYAFKVNEYLTISPDFQWIWRPDGVGKKNVTESGDTIFVYGARGQVGF